MRGASWLCVCVCAVSLSADEGDAVVEEDVTQDDDAADITSQVNIGPGVFGLQQSAAAAQVAAFDASTGALYQQAKGQGFSRGGRPCVYPHLGSSTV